MVDEFGLTPKQRAFCDYYIKLGNATEAARKAGYKYPEQSGKDNTRKQPVKAYIAQRTEAANAKGAADAEEVMLFLSDVMRGKVKDQFGLDASLQDRIKAAQEINKRYAIADQRTQGTMARLDSLFVEFRAALGETGQDAAPGAGDVHALPAPDEDRSEEPGADA